MAKLELMVWSDEIGNAGNVQALKVAAEAAGYKVAEVALRGECVVLTKEGKDDSTEAYASFLLENASAFILREFSRLGFHPTDFTWEFMGRAGGRTYRF